MYVKKKSIVISAGIKSCMIYTNKIHYNRRKKEEGGGCQKKGMQDPKTNIRPNFHARDRPAHAAGQYFTYFLFVYYLFVLFAWLIACEFK